MTTATSAPAGPETRRDDLRKAFGALLRRLQNAVPTPEQKGDPGALAALRRAVGARPGESVAAARIIEPHIPEGEREPTPWEHEVFYIVASLFALHRNHQPIQGRRDQRGLGASLRAIRWREGGDENPGVARRLIAALDAHREALPTHLRQLVTLLSRDHPIDYTQLFDDLLDWDHRDRIVQRAWAAGFWRQPPRAEQSGETTPGDSNN